MRRSTALMSQLRAKTDEGASLHFENCLGGFFSKDSKYELKVAGKTELFYLAGRNLFPLGDQSEENLWGDTVIGIDLAEILEPGKTYTISFEAECVERPPETYTCEGCYRWDYETDEEVYESCGELPLYCFCDALGFALVHYDASYWDYGLGLPENYEHPTVSLFVNKELQQSETYRATVTFTTPGNLQGYTLQCFTNQFYYSHADHPDVYTSTVTFRNIKIEEGDVATGYYGPCGQENIPSEIKCVKGGSIVKFGNQQVVVPCDLYSGDVWHPVTGIVERNTGVTIFTGDEQIISQSSYESYRIDDSLPNCNYAPNVQIICDKYEGKKSGGILSYQSSDGVCWVNYTSPYKYLWFKDKSCESVEDFREKIRGATVIYPLSETVVEQYEPCAIYAPIGTFDMVQEPLGIPASLSATLLVKDENTYVNGWSWKEIQSIVRCGLASKYFKVGDQLKAQRNGATIVFDIIGIDHDTPSDINYKHSLTLQTHDVFWTGIQFDTKKALYYSPYGLSPGTYNFTTPDDFEVSKGNNGKTFSFTTTKYIPAGGIIELVWPWGQALTNTERCWLTTYETNEISAQPLEEKIYLTEEASGISWGVADGINNSNRLNHIANARYGKNVWEISAIRKYLNCDTSNGYIWANEDVFDRPPSWVKSKTEGFLFGFDEEFLSVLGEVNKTTAQPYSIGGGTKEIRELIFLPSCDEVYGGIPYDSVAEGTAYSYYANNSSLSSPGSSNDTNRVKTLKGVAKFWYLRTPYASSAYNQKVVSNTGKISDTSASTAYFAAPVCCIV